MHVQYVLACCHAAASLVRYNHIRITRGRQSDSPADDAEHERLNREYVVSYRQYRQHAYLIVLTQCAIQLPSFQILSKLF